MGIAKGIYISSIIGNSIPDVIRIMIASMKKKPMKQAMIDRKYTIDTEMIQRKFWLQHKLKPANIKAAIRKAQCDFKVKMGSFIAKKLS